MSAKDLMQIVTPKFSQAAYDIAVQKNPDELTTAEVTMCVQCIKWLLDNRAGDPNLPVIAAKFGISSEI